MDDVYRCIESTLSVNKTDSGWENWAPEAAVVDDPSLDLRIQQ